LGKGAVGDRHPVLSDNQVLVYFLARPRQAQWWASGPLRHVERATGRRGSKPAQQLESLARMHDSGQLTDEEFARMKAGVLAERERFVRAPSSGGGRRPG
jgi:hypothetical protein